jgi:hypothetical protein
LELLHDSLAELESAVKRREGLVLAEKLFGLPITSYPLLAQLEADLRKLQQVCVAQSVVQCAGSQWQVVLMKRASHNT